MRRRWKILTGLAIGGASTVVLAVGAARIPFSSDTLRHRLIETLEGRLDAKVELDALTLRLLPTLRITGSGLRVHHKARRDVPPLIAVNTFTVSGGFSDLWQRRIDRVQLDGLNIQIPPDDDDDEVGEKAADAPPSASDGSSNPPTAASDKDNPSMAKQVVITTLEAPNARLVILRRDPAKPPRTWQLHSLRVHDVGVDRSMPFESVLTNAVPPGEIVTSGRFGPWNSVDPGQTPLEGTFTFAKADLSVFKGIAGTLSAQGTYGGELERIAVDGQTYTPDFTITLTGHPVPLSTTYHAIVDATNGNTTLDPVNATFLGTSLVARGGVYEVKELSGRVVRLDIQMPEGRIDDVMQLAVKTQKPPMAGRLHLVTTMTLPPGPADVVEKLQLNGRFRIQRGRFTDPGVQSKVNELSRRATGKMDNMPVATHVTSDFEGQFALNRGRVAIPSVTFDVPGAVVMMGGAYAMRAETIDFNGELYMDAKISQTVTGYKSWLLKMADPIFRKNGRTVIPLKVDGTRNAPHFGLDAGRVFKRGESRLAPKKASSTRPPAGSSAASGATPRLSLR